MYAVVLELFALLCLALTASCGNVLLPSYPLAVKSPYLSAWLAGNHSSHVPTAQPFFWQGQPLTWQVLAHVDGEAYTLFGCPNGVDNATAAKQTSISFTSTHTVVTLNAGSAQITLDFFSPISLTDYVRQSSPYSYLTVSVSGSTCTTTNVDILAAIDDSWTGQRGSNVQAHFQKQDGTLFFSLSGANSIPYTEKLQMATYGDTVLASTASSGNFAASYQLGTPQAVYSAFSKNGSLNGSTGTYKTGNLVAIAQSLCSKASPSATFAVGLQQDGDIQFLGEEQAGYYQTVYKTVPDGVAHVFKDFDAASAESEKLDAQIKTIGQAISTNYSDILEAHMRQIFGGFKVTVPKATLDTSQAMAFMKEISTDGNVNTVADLLPRAFPAFYVLAPDYMRLFLEPLMIFSKQWPANFAFHDIGKHYPNASGETPAAQEKLIVDQTSVLLWMTYAYQKASKNIAWVKPHISDLQRYADYLVKNGLYPAKQKSAVDSIEATANQTILAIYSAIGLTSFGAQTGQSSYTQKGLEFTPVILDQGRDAERTHFVAHYGDPASSWISTYPFAYDKLLGLNTFNESTYAMQSEWYATKEQPFGMQFNSGVNYTVGGLEAWCAATSSPQVRDYFINSIHKTMTSGMNNVPGPGLWFVTGSQQGVFRSGKSKPDAGSYFMIAAVDAEK